MIGWDEILHPDLPKATVVHIWRNQASLADAVQKGYRTILSWGYYLDHLSPAKLSLWHRSRRAARPSN